MPTTETILALMKDRKYFPMNATQLIEVLGVSNEQRASFFELLENMEQSYQIYKSKGDRYLLPSAAGMYVGALSVTDKGFGFVDIEGTSTKSFFIDAAHLNGAIHKDIVLVKLLPEKSGTNQEATVLKIVERGLQVVVGTVDLKEDDCWRIVADDKKLRSILFLMKDPGIALVSGQKVVAHLDTVVSSQKMMLTFEEVIGYKDDPGVDILSRVYSSGAPQKFSSQAIAYAEAIKDEIEAEEYTRRRDLRDRLIVTIDGADAKDLDDAVEVEKLENGNYRLGVHIADVSHYVVDGNPLDKDAYDRGTSIYLADRVIPMIPHVLSNGVCSLNPHVDRLTMSCDMEIDEAGEVVKYDVYESVIHPKARMTYTEVNHILEENFDELSAEKQAISHIFPQMAELAAILRRKLEARGAIDFDIVEPKIVVDENGKAVDVVRRDRGLGERLIEEFMLAANETVASHVFYAELPGIYRVHEEPKVSKLQSFIQLASSLGHPVKGNLLDVHPRALQAVLKQIKGSEAEEVLSTMLLRSLQKARYDAQALGHYGLATKLYTHFTSPIRRYPDLTVHRLLRAYFFEGKVGDDDFVKEMTKRLPIVAEHTSLCEQRAVQLERDVNDMKMAEFMEQHIGSRYSGKISSITNFGLFVTLDNLVEGLVHVSELRDDHYLFVEKLHVLSGQRTGKKYRIGDRVDVIVASASKERSEVDFVLITDKMDDNVVHMLQDKAKNGKMGREARNNLKKRPSRDGGRDRGFKRDGRRDSRGRDDRRDFGRTGERDDRRGFGNRRRDDRPRFEDRRGRDDRPRFEDRRGRDDRRSSYGNRNESRNDSRKNNDFKPREVNREQRETRERNLRIKGRERRRER